MRCSSGAGERLGDGDVVAVSFEDSFDDEIASVVGDLGPGGDRRVPTIAAAIVAAIDRGGDDRRPRRGRRVAIADDPHHRSSTAG